MAQEQLTVLQLVFFSLIYPLLHIKQVPHIFFHSIHQLNNKQTRYEGRRKKHKQKISLARSYHGRIFSTTYVVFTSRAKVMWKFHVDGQIGREKEAIARNLKWTPRLGRYVKRKFRISASAAELLQHNFRERRKPISF